MIVALIEEAVESGAGHSKACHTVGLAPTTIKRWRAAPDTQDRRRGPKTKPKNALSEQERASVASLMNAPEHSSMTPDTLVPYLATLGLYFASQSTFYRIARALKLLSARGRARPRTHRRPQEFKATGPNQVWAWDISVPQKAAREMRDRPLAIGLQEQVANHRKRLGSKALVVSVAEKAP